ncbi:hypothetical protein CC86DRAFT_442094 [Ophiobolus disseminans]|uniref:Aminoglycoside phosphotransferase domain-containing protein n=1 Tax=Ophiobolus disseminans TaxID=1469910 RepID=A0A6A7AKC8_9PLEO|nr:hypothetical protein CC86DRAFT_442094 [Ophiobolus disseminans]
MSQYDISFKPEDLISNIVFSPRPSEVLCRACGWNSYHECCAGYLPRLRVFYTGLNSGLWHMGNDYVLWDRFNDSALRNDYITWKFLKDKGTKDIPLVEEMHHFGKPEDPHQFTIMSRAKGDRLANVWHLSTPEEKENYAQQMTAALRELRQHTSPVPSKVDGQPLWDYLFGRCPGTKMCKTIGKTTDECKMKREFPDPAPYILSHIDLNFDNIMVANGRIIAIIDWERAGYHPWWVERYTSRRMALQYEHHELFDMVWAELDATIDEDAFEATVDNKVAPVLSAWLQCDTYHTEGYDIYLRPPFYKCKPWAALLRRAM